MFARPFFSSPHAPVLAWALPPVFLVAPAPAFAQTPAPQAERGQHEAPPAARSPSPDDALSAWRAKLDDAQRRVTNAQSNERIANQNYSRARSRRYPRGEALQEIKQQQVQTRLEREEAEQDFSVVLEQARRAEVPTGILAPYMDFEDQMQESREESTR